MKPKFRIVKEYRHGRDVFYPERKVLGLFWMRWMNPAYHNVEQYYYSEDLALQCINAGGPKPMTERAKVVWTDTEGHRNV